MREFFALKKRPTKKRENSFLRKVLKLKKTIPEWDNFFGEDNSSSRSDSFVRLEVLGEPLNEKYAWAIPDNRALNIIKNFSPVVEIGSGKGYWAYLLRKLGVDIIAFDKFVPENTWTQVVKGGPKVLERDECQGRTLMLCYPDEEEEMSVKCLKYYQGETIIHIGELLKTGTISGYPQAPFGRTTTSEFNIVLAEQFHCILTASLPNFPFGNDCISVWKRTQFVEDIRHDDDDDNNNEENEPNYWANIPPEERMPNDVAAPCLKHLLRR